MGAVVFTVCGTAAITGAMVLLTFQVNRRRSHESEDQARARVLEFNFKWLLWSLWLPVWVAGIIGLFVGLHALVQHL